MLVDLENAFDKSPEGGGEMEFEEAGCGGVACTVVRTDVG